MLINFADAFYSSTSSKAIEYQISTAGIAIAILGDKFKWEINLYKV